MFLSNCWRTFGRRTNTIRKAHIALCWAKKDSTNSIFILTIFLDKVKNQHFRKLRSIVFKSTHLYKPIYLLNLVVAPLLQHTLNLARVQQVFMFYGRTFNAFLGWPCISFDKWSKSYTKCHRQTCVFVQILILFVCKTASFCSKKARTKNTTETVNE